MKIAVIVLVCFAAYIAAQAPATVDRFTSDYSFTFEFGGGFGAKRAIEVSGQESLLPVEVQKELVKRQASSLVTTVYGNIEADVPNNIWLQTAKKFVLNVAGMDLDFNIDASNLIYYDLNKNYTWDASACECHAIEGSTEMPIISLPPFATVKATGVSITVNGASVSTTEYTASWSGGFNSGSKKRNVQQDFTFQYTFYVDSNNQMRRTVFEVNMSGSTVKTTLDFWNIAAVSANKQILPDSKCSGVCKNAAVETVTTYPATCSPAAQCQCAAPNITFCKDIVTYPTTSLLHLQEVDSFTQTAYNSAVDLMNIAGSVPDSCKSDLKVFLCKFYFPYCSADQNILKPTVDVFECKDGSSSVRDAARENRAFSAYNAADGETTQRSSSAASMVPAILLVVASLFVFNF